MNNQSPARGQLPLALRYPPDQRVETFINPPAGAVPQLRALATDSGGEWFYLQGPEGAGKTHLALAACAMAHDAGRRASYLPLRLMRTRLREALESIDGHDLIAVDDIDVVIGSRDHEVVLFDFHNRARSAGMSVLYTSTAAPSELPWALPDLQSRLSQCTRIVVSRLDDSGRAQVLRERADRRGLAMDDAVIEVILKRVGRDLAGLTALLDRLDHASLAAQRRITVPFLRQTLDGA